MPTGRSPLDGEPIVGRALGRIVACAEGLRRGQFDERDDLYRQ